MTALVALSGPTRVAPSLRKPCAIDETFDDVGVDTRTGVDDNDYQVPFRFTGKLNKLTVKLIPLKAAEEQHLQQQIQDAKNRAQ